MRHKLLLTAAAAIALSSLGWTDTAAGAQPSVAAMRKAAKTKDPVAADAKISKYEAKDAKKQDRIARKKAKVAARKSDAAAKTAGASQ